MRLRQALAALHRALDLPDEDPISPLTPLMADRLQVRLNAELVTTDVAEWEGAIQSAARAETPEARAGHLQRAVALYKGELLPGYYEEFILSHRQRLAEAHRAALVSLANTLTELKDFGAATQAARQAVTTDPTDEEAQFTLIRIYQVAGRTSDALRQARELERILRKELDAAPAAATQDFLRQLRAATPEPVPANAVVPLPVIIPEVANPPVSGEHPLPVGTLTFFLTDIEDSTQLWEQQPDAMRRALLRHESLASSLIERHHGRLVKTRGEGDNLFAVFSRAQEALACACDLQTAFQEEPWPAGTPLRIRIALHTGEAAPGDTDYYGSAVNRCARIRALAKGGDTLLSLSTEQLVRDAVPNHWLLRDLGEQRLRGLTRPERVFLLVHAAHSERRTRPLRQRARTFLLVLLLGVVLAAVGRSLWLRTTQRLPETALDRKVVAVLPFDIISSDGSRDAYFADGLTEEMTNALGKIQGLTVIGRISAAQIKDRLTNGNTGGSGLNVGTLILGKVSREQSKLRVYVQAVDAQSQRTIWSEEYDKPYRVDDVLEMESDVAQRVASAVRVSLTAGEQGQIGHKFTENFAAYDDYLQGRYLWNQRTEEALKRSITFFDRAIALDPHYAPAYVGKADVYDLLGYYGYSNSQEASQEARTAAERALAEAAGDTGILAAAHTSLAWTKMIYERDWAGTEAEFAEVKRLSPEYATAYQWHSLSLLLQGHTQESIDEILLALQKDPLSFIIGTSIGGRYYYAGRYDAAVRQYDGVLALNPGYTVAFFWRGLAYEKLRRYPQAAADFAVAVNASHRTPLFLAFQGKDFATAGQRAKAVAIREELRRRSVQGYVSPFCLAVIEAGLGDRDQTFSLLQKAYDQHDGSLTFLEEAAPAFASLRSDPRFQLLRLKMGFPRKFHALH